MPAIRYLGWLPIALLGCGKLGFDPLLDAAVDAEADAAPDAPPIPLCDRFPTAIYCNEFEGGALGGAGSLNAVAAPGAGWMGSDGYTVTANPGGTPLLRFNLPAAVTTGELHIGGRMLLSAGPPSANYVVVGQALSPSFEKVSFDFNSNDRAQLVNTINAAGGQMGPDDSFPRGRWACFELVVVVAAAGGGGSATVLVDGTPVIVAFENLETLPPGGFSRVEIGAVSSPANTAPETLVFDNWIIATESIGCP